MSFRISEIKNSEIDLRTLEAIAFCLIKLSKEPCKTVKSGWSRKYAHEVGVCAELDLISLQSEFHEMSRDSKLKLVTEVKRFDFSMGAWNINPKGRKVLLEIKNKYITTIPWIGAFESDHFDDEKYYFPNGW